MSADLFGPSAEAQQDRRLLGTLAKYVEVDKFKRSNITTALRLVREEFMRERPSFGS
jgi:hypothetical protein